LQIFLYFTHNIKKWHFDIHFDDIMLKVQLGCHHTAPSPILLNFTVVSDHPKAGAPDIVWFAVWHGASQHSNQIPVLRHTECWGWRVLSWVCSQAYYKLTNGAAPFWANSRNLSVLLHT
jgi:hypothetical protein